MNCPHPIAFRQELTLAQVQRSWSDPRGESRRCFDRLSLFRYMFFSQSPFIPEMLLQSDDLALFHQAFRKKPMGLVNKELMTDEDLEVFKYTFSQEGRVS